MSTEEKRVRGCKLMGKRNKKKMKDSKYSNNTTSASAQRIYTQWSVACFLSSLLYHYYYCCCCCCGMLCCYVICYHNRHHSYGTHRWASRSSVVSAEVRRWSVPCDISSCRQRKRSVDSLHWHQSAADSRSCQFTICLWLLGCPT